MSAAGDLIEASLRLERETGYDSIPTVAGHYTAYDGEIEPTSGVLECVYPTCLFRRKSAEAMWIHVHFGPHGKSFGFTIDELRADLALEPRS